MYASEMQTTALRFYPRIQKIARGIARNLPAHVDANDLVQAGVVGMMGALRAFDRSRTESLEFYVERRIRGAILDELRALDPLSRDERKDARTIQAATRALEGEFGRAAEESEIAARAGLAVERVRAVRQRVAAILQEPLDDEGAPSLADLWAIDPTAMLAASELRERLVGALTELTERERQVVALYYVEELSLREIGGLFGVSESRICQIHGEVVKKLRLALSDA